MNERETMLQAEAVLALKDHVFTKVAGWGNDCGVWHCAKPGDSNLAFDICVTRLGIAVVGDIDALAFRVGSRYGLPFLAGDDVGYYIHSKLEAANRAEEELDKEALVFWATELVMAALNEQWDETQLAVISRVLGQPLPEWLTEPRECAKHPAECLALLEKLAYQFETELAAAIEQATNDGWPAWLTGGDLARCERLLRDLAELSERDGITAAHERLHEFENEVFDVFDVSFDACDLQFARPTTDLMYRLYLVNAAAKKIVAQEAAEQATAEQAAGPAPAPVSATTPAATPAPAGPEAS